MTEIIALLKEQWKGTVIPLSVRSDSWYDFEIKPLDQTGCSVTIVRKAAEQEIGHS